MTEEQRAELEKLARAATGGDWEVHSIDHPYPAKSVKGFADFPAGSYTEWRVRTGWIHGQAKDKVSVIGLASGLDGPSVWLSEEDAAYIVAACNAVPDLLATIARLEAENVKDGEALEKIERWFGEFPETGLFWPNEDGTESDRPVSYGAEYGSNGERDFMRQIARARLSSRAKDQSQ